MQQLQNSIPQKDGLPDEETKCAKFPTVQPCELHARHILKCGEQADVYQAMWKRSFAVITSAIVVAVKRLHDDLGPMHRNREALAVATDHPNLVRCFDATEDPPYLLVTEFCAGGTLFDLLYTSRQELSSRQCVKLLLDVASGMKYVHAQSPCILHGDLKSSNVLLTKVIKSSDQDPFAKVADVGLSRTSAGYGSNVELMAGVESWRWMAPEVFALDENDSYDERIDVYSFAMLMYEVLVRKLPYSDQFPTDRPDPRLGIAVCQGLRPNVADVHPEFPSVLKDMMQQCWHSEPSQRPNFEELVQSLRELFASFGWRTLPDADDLSFAS